MTGAPASEQAALSRELADFLIERSIALHKHAMYREGHPSLAPAAAGVTRRAERLFEERATLALGVARGLEFDPEMCAAFVRMMKQWEGQVTVVSDTVTPIAASPAAPTDQPSV